MSTESPTKITDVIQTDAVIKDILSTSTVAWDQFVGRTSLEQIVHYFCMFWFGCHVAYSPTGHCHAL